jgi:peptidoglycan/LPS O-acetylase OafA/YrhL
VVIYHTLLTDPRIAQIYLHPEGQELNAVEQIFFYSPLRILWAGREAVLVFFVLSGFVLALPAGRGRTESWPSYYPRRIVRLYLPSIASLIFAFLTALMVSRSVVPGASEWLNQHAIDKHGAMQVLLGSTLMGGAGGLNTPLWSLRWEVIFSLLLPLYLLCGKYLRRFPALAFCLLLGVAVVGAATGLMDGALIYLPIFGIGVLMAYNVASFASLAVRVNRLGWIALGVAAALLMTFTWVSGVFLGADALGPWAVVLPISGAALTVFVCAWCPAAGHALAASSIQWLGKISFSLYLIHEPIAVAVSFATGGSLALWVNLLVSVGLSLLLAELFFRLVERPSHKLSRIVGARIGETRRKGVAISDDSRM